MTTLNYINPQHITMSLLQLVFLLCTRFIAQRERRLKTSQEDTLTVRFSNGADPVVFSAQTIRSDKQSPQWTASRKLSQTEAEVAVKVLRCRIKKERRKLRFLQRKWDDEQAYQYYFDNHSGGWQC